MGDQGDVMEVRNYVSGITLKYLDEPATTW